MFLTASERGTPVRTYTKLGAGLALATALAVALPVSAEPATAGWFDSYGKNANERAVALQAAIAQQQAREGGYGPGSSYTTINGDYNQYQTYNGSVTSSSASNSVNSNSTSVQVNGSNVVIDVATQQGSGNSSQGASSTSGTGGVVGGNACSSGSCP